MSWCEATRRALAALVLLPLVACGFHPLYAERTPLGYNPTLAAIKVQPVPDRIGQILVAALREQLNPRGAALEPQYVLIVNISVARSDLGFRRDNTSSRAELAINASLQLNSARSEKIAFQDTINTVTSFNLPDDAYAATVAEEHAREEAAKDLGREIAQRLAVFVRSRENGGGGA
jgi:LPS-assembly lipoprotein